MQLRSIVEVSGRLVGLPAFKAGGTGEPRPAGSIPVHLRQDKQAKLPAARSALLVGQTGVSDSPVDASRSDAGYEWRHDGGAADQPCA